MAVTEVTHDRLHERGEITDSLDLGQALADLRYTACNVHEFPDPLLRSGSLFAPASTLTPSVKHLHQRAAGNVLLCAPRRVASSRARASPNLGRTSPRRLWCPAQLVAIEQGTHEGEHSAVEQPGRNDDDTSRRAPRPEHRSGRRTAVRWPDVDVRSARTRSSFCSTIPTRTHNLRTVAPTRDQVAGTSQDTAVTPLATRPCLGSRQIAGARCRQFGRFEGPAQESANAPVSISRHFHCLLA